MKTLSMAEQELRPDAQLVEFSLLGDREAFGRIVERYQSLICALAYTACGDLSRSEDLAQETFVAAWRNLPSLQEPSRLKQWLCGIVRNRIRDHCRRDTRDPVADSAPIGEVETPDLENPPPSDEVISKEEQAILWRVLEGLPRAYRDPLILYYRQDQSLAEVSEALEISEDAAKQRLSRGRALLTDRMARFVETALHRSMPTRALTFAVLAALPVSVGTASAATVGATVAKGTAAAKAGATIGLVGAIMGPIIGIIGGWVGLKTSLANATSLQERRLIFRFTGIVIGLVIVCVGANVWLGFFGKDVLKAQPALVSSLVIGFWVLYGVTLLVLILRFNKRQRQIRQNAAATGTAKPIPSAKMIRPLEYRSRWTFLGLPLIHVRLGRRPDDPLRPALGWIAIGDWAIGVLFSFGGIAFGGISIGGISAGLISIGGIALGLLAGGGLAIGSWAVAGAAMGYVAVGGFALAWHAAQGGVAVAQHFAQGGAAQAQHANDAVARAFFDSHTFFEYAGDAIRGSGWLVLLCWLPMLLILWHTTRARCARREARSQPR